MSLSAAGVAAIFACNGAGSGSGMCGTIHNLQVSQNGSAYYPMAITSGSLNNGDCVSISVVSSVATLVDAGGACTTGGGGGTVTPSAQFDVPYYSGTGTSSTLSGTGNFLLTGPTGSTPTLGLGTGGNNGIFQANGTSGGFDAPACTAFNCFQSPNGGMYASQFTWKQSGAPSLSASGTAAVYADTSASPPPVLHVSINGGAYAGVATFAGALTNGDCVSINSVGNFVDFGGPCGGGSGSGTINNSAQFDIPYYSAAGSSNVLSGTGNLLIAGPTGSTPTIGLGTGGNSGTFQANGTGGGFNSPSCTAFNCHQAPLGGMYALNFDATNYIQSGNNTGSGFSPPPLVGGDSFHPGAMFFSIGAGTELVCTMNPCSSSSTSGGSGWVSLAAGGVTFLNSLAGSLTLACHNTASTGDNCTITPAGTTITIATPQPLATSSGVTFGSVISTSVFNSSGSGITFQNSSGSFQVNSSGTVSASGVGTFNGGVSAPNTAFGAIQTTGGINACSGSGCTGGSAYAVAGSEVINSSGEFVSGAGVNTSGTVEAAFVYSTGNIAANSLFAVGPFGGPYSFGVSCSTGTVNLTTFTVVGGIVVHC